jgi:serine/threonine protein phosphatase 1
MSGSRISMAASARSLATRAIGIFREAPIRIVNLPNDGGIVYAVGDLHGCRDQLVSIEARMFGEAGRTGIRSTIVHLGDMIDRGPDSAGVLDRLLSKPPQGFDRLCLLGNHEAAMLRFLEHPTDASWLVNGGFETLRSYGLMIPRSGMLSRKQLHDLAGEALATIPSEHLEFIRALPAAVVFAGYVFVHAGIRRGIDMRRQRLRDVLEMRRADGYGSAGDPRIVVHGHSVVAEAVDEAGDIGVDTGCYATGRLSAVRIESCRHSFLTVTNRPDEQAAATLPTANKMQDQRTKRARAW